MLSLFIIPPDNHLKLFTVVIYEGATTFSIATLSITTFSITALNAECRSC